MDRAGSDPDRRWIAAALHQRLGPVPPAPVFAPDEWAGGTPLPDSVGAAGHPVLDVRAAVDLVREEDRPMAVRLWNEARSRGAARVRTSLRDGDEIVLVLYDLRPEHGVVVGILLPPSDDGGDVPSLP